MKYYILLSLTILNSVFIILSFIKRKQIMAKLDDLKQALADLQASVDANQATVIVKIQALKDQIAAGGTVTDADLDGLIATVQSIKTDVDTTDEGLS